MLGCLNCWLRDVLSWSGGQLRVGHILQNNVWVSLVVSHSTSPWFHLLQMSCWALSGQWLGKKPPQTYILFWSQYHFLLWLWEYLYLMTFAYRPANSLAPPYTCVAVQWQARLGLIQPLLKATEGFPKQPVAAASGTFLWWEKSLEQAKNAFVFPDTRVFPPMEHPHLSSYNR